ncbi:MAG: hypothetical protein A2150_05310 [Candidatus Muproteobacteria bacterium RBG_16_64_11]|uniref:Diguanylate cyclase n=1 Tax=Candidatus Muproteobacteria bacterium RBG_16_64_11 TaxID=1817758 RepID=A0A1F6THF0_9PROT|nr:MAG: hypothetical protein A2150_05310 [Candidatus Muproteobacteria bacterium RBG_16_64_11]
MTLLVFALAGAMAWFGYREYSAAKQMLHANETADHLIRAAGIVAVERGLIAAALGSRRPADAATRQRIEELRRSADQIWQAASGLAATLATANDTNTSFVTAIDTTAHAYNKLRAARERVDGCLSKPPACAVGGPEWIAVVSGFIEAADRMREEIFLAVEAPRQVTQYNLTMKRWAAVASENAGRERGFLAYYIGARQPLPQPVADSLRTYRGVVDRTTGEIIAFSKRPDTEARVVQAVQAMQGEFLGGYERLRRQVYAAAGSGNYPVDAGQWLAASTRAIDTLLAISNVMSQITGEFAYREMQVKTAQMALGLGLMVVTLVLAMVGLTRVRQTANDLFYQKELAEVTLHSIGDAVVTTDAEARVVYLNPVAEELTGWSRVEARGRPLKEVFHIVSGRTREPEPNPVDECLRERRVVGLAGNTVLIRRDGTEYVIEDSAAPIFDYAGKIVGGVMVFYDVSLTRRVPHLLSYHATHDALTGLINRREFERHLAELLVQSRNSGQQHALGYVDLDQFKVVNDICGHNVGDRLLAQLAYLLRARVRDSDILARLGGDEFGMLMENCPIERAVQIADKLRQVVKDFRFVWQDRIFDVGVSIGLVPITADSVSAAELLSEADAACYAAKENGRNRVQVYQPGNLELARRHGEMQWVPRIHKALEEDRFRLYCQTIMPLADDQAMHGEVLLRLEDEDGNLVPPLAFIPAAERYNLMPAIDRWVIRAALSAVGGYLRSQPQPCDLQCSINLSGVSLGDEGLQGYIREQLDLHRVPPAAVCFEITESAAIANLERAAVFMRSLRELGCRFALDDFGSGLSSFAYLKTLPVDYLKIDGTFVRAVADDAVARAMVQAINTVGHVMGIKTVAEYVETGRILDEVRRIGVDYAQGYAIGYPRPIAECLPRCGRTGQGSPDQADSE